MSRLEARLKKLEGGTASVIDIVARVPDWWPGERRNAEIEAIARALG